MGINLCCQNDINKEENESSEMKDGIIPETYNQEKVKKDIKYITDSQFINSDQQKIEEIFYYFNKIRNNPKEYISEFNKYNLNNIISLLIKKNEKGKIKNLVKNPYFDLFFDKCVKSFPQSKEDILNKMEKEKLFKDYEKKLFLEEGVKENISQCVWNLIKNCFYNGEDILNENIDYLVIDIINLDDNNKFLGYFLFLSRIKEKNEKNNIYSIDDD